MEAGYPLEFESVTSSPLEGDKVVVQLEGRWRGRGRPSLERPMLVVEVDGRRHRFPAITQPRRARIRRPGGWSGSFALPTWLQAYLEGNTALRLGDINIPVPAGSFEGVGSEPPEPAAQSPEP